MVYCKLSRVGLALLALCAACVCGDVCDSVTAGIKTANKNQLDNVVLSPGQPAYDVEIPSSACAPLTHLGTTLLACDAALAPAVTLESVTRGSVHRRGPWTSSPGMLYTYVYCA